MTTYTIYLIILVVIFAIYYTVLIVGLYQRDTLFVDEYSEEKAFGFKPVVVNDCEIDIVQEEMEEIEVPEIIEDIPQNIEDGEEYYRDMRARIENSLVNSEIEDPSYQQTLDSQTMLLMMNQPIDKRKKIKRTTIFP